MTKLNKTSLVGMLVIGDPHLEGRQPGFRKDDYPETILRKVEWCLEYARKENLLPAFLGDMFQFPRDNPTWMLTRLIEMLLGSNAIGIYGNHDCAEPELTDNDSLSLLIKSGCLQIVDYQNPWRGEMNGRTVFVGGSSYRQVVPESFPMAAGGNKSSLFEFDPLVVWLTHHDIEIPGYDAGKFKPREIENVDLLINGHIHKPSDPVQAGKTLWLHPGNISRRSRSQKTRDHVPKALRIDVEGKGYQLIDVIIPHQSFEEVFFESSDVEQSQIESSKFIDGLKDLTSRKTQSGAGLKEFLAKNLHQFESEVVNEIESLASEILETH